MNIRNFYRCLGCGREYSAEHDAKLCCAVVQEIFQCDVCRAEFPTKRKARQHRVEQHGDDAAASVSTQFAAMAAAA